MRFDFELNLPRLQGEGQYDINGQILTLPLRGNGPFTGNFSKFLFSDYLGKVFFFFLFLLLISYLNYSEFLCIRKNYFRTQNCQWR